MKAALQSALWTCMCYHVLHAITFYHLLPDLLKWSFFHDELLCTVVHLTDWKPFQEASGSAPSANSNRGCWLGQHLAEFRMIAREALNIIYGRNMEKYGKTTKSQPTDEVCQKSGAAWSAQWQWQSKVCLGRSQRYFTVWIWACLQLKLEVSGGERTNIFIILRYHSSNRIYQCKSIHSSRHAMYSGFGCGGRKKEEEELRSRRQL